MTEKPELPEPPKPIDPYYAIGLQTRLEAINHCQNRKQAHKVMMGAVERLAAEIANTKRFIGEDVRLIVLPEYFLSSYPMGESIDAWAQKACLTPDAPEYKQLCKIAEENNLFLSGNVYELDAHFDGLYFQTSFIIDPKGEVILRYRRLNSMFAPTPHDVWDKYVSIYGLDGVFPVARTPIGQLACIASEEILYPEIARALAMRGAEMFLHSTGEIGSPLDTKKTIAKKARAVENMAYLVSANAGGIKNHVIPESATDGRSMIIDHRGMVLAESGWGETMTAHAIIDMTALRQARRRPGMSNYLSRQRLQAFADTYSQLASHPANSLLQGDKHIVPERAHFKKAQTDALHWLIKNKIIM